MLLLQQMDLGSPHSPNPYFICSFYSVIRSILMERVEISKRLDFLICEMGIIIEPTSWGHFEESMR